MNSKNGDVSRRFEHAKPSEVFDRLSEYTQSGQMTTELFQENAFLYSLENENLVRIDTLSGNRVTISK